MLLRGRGWKSGVGGAGRTGPGFTLVAAVLVVLCTVPPTLPQAAWSITLRQSSRTTQVSHAQETATFVAEADAVRQRIGPRSTVTYLTFGDRNHTLRNPTPCRFPTNVFLQRSRYAHGHEGTETWRENLSCLTEADTDWLVWDKSWFSLKGEPAVVKAAIEERFDCGKGFTEGALTVCPRRR